MNEKRLTVIRQAFLWGDHTTIQPTVICVGNDEDDDVLQCKSYTVFLLVCGKNKVCDLKIQIIIRLFFVFCANRH